MRSHKAGVLTRANEGDSVTLTGWVARRRDHGGVAFIDLRDASGWVQVVINDESVAAAFTGGGPKFSAPAMRPSGYINLYMPDTVSLSQHASYNDISMTQALGAAGNAVTASMTPQQLYNQYASVIFGTPTASYTTDFRGTQGTQTSGTQLNIGGGKGLFSGMGL